MQGIDLSPKLSNRAGRGGLIEDFFFGSLHFVFRRLFKICLIILLS